MDVVPGPRVRLAFAAIVFDLVSPRGLPNKLLLGLAAPALAKQSNKKTQVNIKKKIMTRWVKLKNTLRPDLPKSF